MLFFARFVKLIFIFALCGGIYNVFTYFLIIINI